MHKNLSKKAQKQFSDLNSEWRPDWKDSYQYPNPKNTSRAQWAWEFLRRNPDYRKDYLERVIFEKKPINPEEGPKSYIYFRKKYRILCSPNDFCVPNPASSSLGSATFDKKKIYAFRKPKSSKEKNYKAWCPLHDGDAAVIFNLNLPISSQLEQAKKALEEMQDQMMKEKIISLSSFRIRENHYQNYLRALDGREEGAKYKEIGEVISGDPDEKRAGELIKAARLLRDKNYRLI
jgi:hypothetical protein